MSTSMNPGIVKLFIQSGVIVGVIACSTTIPPSAGIASLIGALATASGSTVGGAAGSFLANMLENVGDNFCQKNGKEAFLRNLSGVTGEAIAAIVRSEIKNLPTFPVLSREKSQLKKLANFTSKKWYKVLNNNSQWQTQDVSYKDLGIQEIDLPKYFLNDPSQFDKLSALTEPIWQEILQDLAKIANVQIPHSSISSCAKQLHLDFSKELRKSLERKGKEAFEELSMLVWEELYQTIKNNQAEILQKLDVLEKKDLGISDEIESISVKLQQSIDGCQRIEHTQRVFLSQFSFKICSRIEEVKAIAAKNLALSEEMAKDVEEVKQGTRQLLQMFSKPETSDRPLSSSPIPASQVFNLLMTLDFETQSQLVGEITERDRIASFLVHGGLACGQRYLVKRLCRLQRKWHLYSPIKIDMYSNGVGIAIPHIWQQIGSNFNLPAMAKEDEILDRIRSFWHERDVIMVFYAVDKMLPKDLDGWIEEFWQPLVDRCYCESDRVSNHLLMFLVDDCGKICQSGVKLSSNFNAVNTALFLEKRPLLLKGEPGCGKTRLAQAVAWELGWLDSYYPWYIKSTTRAKDGLYIYDAVKRLQDAQLSGSNSPLQNEAIQRLNNENHEAYIRYGELGNAYQSSQKAVVLIDEIDKADIDFPNDLLRELDEQEFTIEETRSLIKANTPPLVFITSNDEKDLPDAFLRRCLFFYIEFPKTEELKQIVKAHFPESGGDLVSAAVDRFCQLRDLMQNKGYKGKKVTTSELIDWFYLLSSDPDEKSTANQLQQSLPFPEVLLKRIEDRDLLTQLNP